MSELNPDVIIKAVEEARKKLLDTSRRNRLINCRPSRSSGAEIIGESPDFVFNFLVGEGKKLELKGKPDPNIKETFFDVPPNSLEPVDEIDSDADPTDRFLNCAETKSTLAKKLLKTWRDQRTLMEETGVNTLFLSLGMVVWLDEDAKKSERRSPLILVPVSLVRKPGGDRYELEWDGSDPIQNLSIQALLRDEFRVVLPDINANEELIPSNYFMDVKTVVEAKEWTVDVNAISLGFFGSAKYLLYADLDSNRWPGGQSPADHSILQKILNPDPEELLSSPGLGFSEGELLDPHRKISDCHEVVDCDGSQILAIMQAATGSTMVIEGPPGTGKSQTITNLLADAVARGKRVLFVAEKLAALNVVARNLDRVGLRHLCLELHSNKTNKALFYKNLVATLANAAPVLGDTQHLKDLESMRNELNLYPGIVNQSVQSFGVTPREAIGRLLELGEDNLAGTRIPDSELESLNQKKVNEGLTVLESAEEWVKKYSSPEMHPFKDMQKYLDPFEIKKLIANLETAKNAIGKLRDQSRQAAKSLAVLPPSNIEESQQIHRALETCTERPDLSFVCTDHEVLDANPSLIGESLSNARTWAEIYNAHSIGMNEEQWTFISSLSIDKISILKKGITRVLIKKYYTYKKLADACHRNRHSTDLERFHFLDLLLSGTVHCESLKCHLGELQKVFPSADIDPAIPWAEWEEIWNWLQSARQGSRDGLLPTDFIKSVPAIDPQGAVTATAELIEALNSVNDSLSALKELGMQLHTSEFESLLNQFQIMIQLENRAHEWSTWIDKKNQISISGFENFLSFALSSQNVEHITELLSRSFYEHVLSVAYQDPVLRGFNVLDHERNVRRFCELDKQLLSYNRKKIVANHARALPAGSGGGGGIGTIQKEAQKQRRHKSIRRTMEDAWPAIQKIKPIFMMSPVSIAMYLPQNGPKFDLVIFDEASQIKPEEALGAIARGIQIIVVGDSKQMPPSSFFERMTTEGSDEENEEEATAGLESILDLLSSRIPNRSSSRRDLRWHYRSQHASLITPSNGLFYDWRLFIVPNPSPPNESSGLHFHHLPNSFYDRGNTRTNKGEAEEVAKAIIKNLRECPKQSVMAVAFSQAQQEAIQFELDLLLKQNPELELAFANSHPTEPLDVKNLENVQGDERDVVFISIGYGRTKEGYVAQAFGPLNQEGGWRRLNVLITRARIRCEVFTNMRPDDIKSEGRGPTALRAFLNFADSGHMDVPKATGVEPMSIFEEQVICALVREGYTCEPQVGDAGFFVDIGVRDPNNSNRFCLGIECDGAQYHRSATARDRDRLRQDVLENRGWRIARVWSTDWFKDSESATKRLVDEIKKSLTEEPILLHRASQIEPLSSSEVSELKSVPLPPVAACKPYVVAQINGLSSWDVSEMYSSRLVPIMKQVIEFEAPILLDEVIRRIREASGGGRSGNRIREVFYTLAKQATPSGMKLSKKWYLPQELPARDRAALPVSFKNHVLIHDLEVQNAMAIVLKAEVAVPAQSLIKQAFALLGISRVSVDALKRGDELIKQALKENWIIETSAGLALPSAQVKI